MPPRESLFGRLMRHFHTHPRGRLHEMLFWSAIGVLIIIGTYFWWRSGHLDDPFAILFVIVAICFIGFALLPHPQKHEHAPPPPKGKRGQIAEQVKKSKSEKRKPPPPPIG